MLESVYISFIFISFLIFISSFFVKKLGNKILLLGMCFVFFILLAFSSADVEVIFCSITSVNSSVVNGLASYIPTTNCAPQHFNYQYMMYAFAGMILIASITILVRIFQALDHKKNGVNLQNEDE